MNSKLTPRQEAFARAIVFDELTHADAYRRSYPRSASWKASTVHEAASRLAASSKVAERIDELKVDKEARYEAEARKREITPEQIVAEQARAAFFDPGLMFDEQGQLLPLHEMPEDARRAVQAVKIRGIKSGDKSIRGVVAEITLNDKLTALRHLGEHLGMYQQVHQHSWMDEIAAMTEDELQAEEERLDKEILRLSAQRKKALN